MLRNNLLVCLLTRFFKGFGGQCMFVFKSQRSCIELFWTRFMSLVVGRGPGPNLSRFPDGLLHCIIGALNVSLQPPALPEGKQAQFLLLLKNPDSNSKPRLWCQQHFGSTCFARSWQHWHLLLKKPVRRWSSTGISADSQRTKFPWSHCLLHWSIHQAVPDRNHKVQVSRAGIVHILCPQKVQCFLSPKGRHSLWPKFGCSDLRAKMEIEHCHPASRGEEVKWLQMLPCLLGVEHLRPKLFSSCPQHSQASFVD